MSEIDKIQLKDASGQTIAEYDLPGGSGTDEKVMQIRSDEFNDLIELLMTEHGNTATIAEMARKSSNFRVHPYLKALIVGTRDLTASIGEYSTSLGTQLIASGYSSHAEGAAAKATNIASHAEGSNTTSSGNGSHAEGIGTLAYADGAHAEGYGTLAVSAYQHAEGKYNIGDSNNVYAHIIGNGTDNSNRSNAFAVRWDGQVDATNDIVRTDTNGTWDGTNTSLEDAISDINDAIDDIDITLATKANESIIADAYDNTSTYLVGDYCMYENALYICNTDISTAEDFDSTHWDPITIITSIDSKVSKSGDTMTGKLIGMGGGGAYNKARDYASFKKTDVASASAFYPIASLKANDSDWSIGVLGTNDRLVFCNVLDTNYSGNVNASRKFYLEPATAATDNLNHRIAHSGNVETGDSNGQVKIAGANVDVKGLASSAYVATSNTYNATGTTSATTTAVYNARKDINNNLIAATWVTFDSASVSSKTLKNFSKKSTKSGYTPLGILEFNTTNGEAYLCTSSAGSDGTITLSIYNNASSAKTLTPTAKVLWVRSSIS